MTRFEKYIGLPYRALGRARDGIDCYGLVHLIYVEELGVEVPSYADDYDDPNSAAQASTAIKERCGEWQQVIKPKPFDVLVFNIYGLPAHCAVYIGNGDFLHSMKETQSCVERLNSVTWKERLAGIYRWVS